MNEQHQGIKIKGPGAVPGTFQDLSASGGPLAAPCSGMGTGLRICLASFGHHAAKCQDSSMTSLVCWVGVDDRKVASLYIASDSRLTWPGGAHWDQGRKAFAANNAPFIFGYWGDVLFPALALPVVQEKVDRGFVSSMPGQRAHDAIAHTIRTMWRDYPKTERRTLGILIGSRAGEFMPCRFLLTVLTYRPETDEWVTTSMPMPTESSVLRYAGSGTESMKNSHLRWEESVARGTSRAVFSAFCDSLEAGEDPDSGGPPQLVGLIRKGNAQSFGLIHQQRRFIAGTPSHRNEAWEGVNWFNRLFERVRADTKKRMRGAQKHTRL